MPHNFRPLLDTSIPETANITNPKLIASFSELSTNHVLAISNCIDVDSANAHESEIDSVPDVWARMLNFEIALYDKKHVMHQSIWQEWCGFLTLIALCNLKSVPLTAQEIDLSKIDHNHPYFGHPFVQSLKTMLPNREALHPLSPWSLIHVFLLNGYPIGISNNQTLISTSADYNFLHYAVPSVSWINPQGKLISPCNLKDNHPVLGTGDEYVALALWLQRLDQDLLATLGNKYTLNQGVHTRSLQNLIHSFGSELILFCQQHLHDPGIRPALVEAGRDKKAEEKHLNIFIQKLGKAPFNFGQSPINCPPQATNPIFKFQGVYSSFNQVIAPPSVDLNTSYVLVHSLRPVGTQLLLIDPEVQGSLGLPASNIRIYSSLSLAGITLDLLGQQHDKLMGHELVGAEWIRPEAFFTPELKLVAGKREAQMPDTLEVAGISGLRLEDAPMTPILPIAEKVLKYLGPDYLSKNLSFVQKGHEIDVKLRLLLGPDQVEHYVHHTYDLNKNVALIEHQAHYQVWPNFTHPNLKNYYSYFTAQGQAEWGSFYTLPYHSSGRIIEYSQYNANGELVEERIESLDKFNAGTNNKLIDKELARLEFYPEAILCYSQENPASPRREYIGCILVKPPTPLQGSGQTAVIGVDLGTSSTNLYMNFNGEMKPVVFHDPQASLFGMISFASSSNYLHFLPEHAKKIEQAPLITLYETFQETNESPVNLLQGHVRFLDDFLAVDLKKHEIKKDLKWSAHTDGDQKDKADAKKAAQKCLTPFFLQLCLQATISAVQKGAGQIVFRFSHPSAFNSTQRQQFNQAIQNALGKLQNIYTNIAYDEQNSLRESVASAYFFNTGQAGVPRANIHDGVIVMDIGGGTTDISVIQGSDGKFRFLSSVKLAGRSLFTETLLRHVSFFKTFGLKLPDGVESALDQQQLPPWIYPQLDALIKGNEENIIKKLPENYGSIKQVIDEMAIGVAGLFYYMGIIVQALRRMDRYDAPEDSLPLFYVGGNGSKIFHWFTHGQSYSKATIRPYDALFERAFLHKQEKNASDPFYETKEVTEIQVYPTPSGAGSKPEVATGLVLDPGMRKIDDQGIRTLYFAGEEHVLAGEKRDHLTWLQREEMPQLDPQSMGQTQISQFIDIIDQELNLKLNKKKLLAAIGSEVKGHLSDVHKHVEAIEDECAIFIQEVKALLRFIKGAK